MKVAAYSPTAAWLASVFTALPILAVLTVLGLYSFYLLVSRPSGPDAGAAGQDRSAICSSVIVCAIIVWALDPARCPRGCSDSR